MLYLNIWLNVVQHINDKPSFSIVDRSRDKELREFFFGEIKIRGGGGGHLALAYNIINLAILEQDNLCAKFYATVSRYTRNTKTFVLFEFIVQR